MHQNREGRLTAAPADIAEQEHKTWKERLDKLKQWQSSPWREDEGRRRCEAVPALPDIRGEGIKKSSRHFFGEDWMGCRQLWPAPIHVAL